MIPENPEELRALAGEYVLGVLEPQTAREIEAALAGNAALRREVVFWEERFHELSRLAPPETPPPETWDKIAARIADMPPIARPPIWRSLAFWRASAALAAAVAAALAIYVAVAPPLATGPSFVAVLRTPQQDQPAWVATAGPNGLLVRAVAGPAAPSDRSFELWAIAPGATPPQSLGVIPSDGRLELAVLPDAIRQGGTLAISLEPKGGSPTGQPTGPVVFSGALTAAR